MAEKKSVEAMGQLGGYGVRLRTGRAAQHNEEAAVSANENIAAVDPAAEKCFGCVLDFRLLLRPAIAIGLLDFVEADEMELGDIQRFPSLRHGAKAREKVRKIGMSGGAQRRILRHGLRTQAKGLCFRNAKPLSAQEKSLPKP
jgi:hypothetical protein